MADQVPGRKDHMIAGIERQLIVDRFGEAAADGELVVTWTTIWVSSNFSLSYFSPQLGPFLNWLAGGSIN